MGNGNIRQAYWASLVCLFAITNASYVQIVRGDNVIRSEHIQYLQLSNAVYEVRGRTTGGQTKGWSRVKGGVYKSGLKWGLYERPTSDGKKEQVMAFAGTDPSPTDIITDIGQFYATPNQYIEAADLVKEYYKKATDNGNSFSLTGHSLGGGIAQYAAIIIPEEEMNIPAVVFNSAGLVHTSDKVNDVIGLKIQRQRKLKDKIDKDKLAISITNYQVNGDPVSAVGAQFGKVVKIGPELGSEYRSEYNAAKDQLSQWIANDQLKRRNNYHSRTDNMLDRTNDRKEQSAKKVKQAEWWSKPFVWSWEKTKNTAIDTGEVVINGADFVATTGVLLGASLIEGVGKGVLGAGLKLNTNIDENSLGSFIRYHGRKQIFFASGLDIEDPEYSIGDSMFTSADVLDPGKFSESPALFLLPNNFPAYTDIFSLGNTFSTGVFQGNPFLTDTRRLDDNRQQVLVRSGVLDLARRRAFNAVDVFFLADNTGSMSNAIAEVKTKAQAILNALAGNDPRFANVNIQWGVGRYSDDQITNPGNPGYQLLQPITDDQTAVQAALDQWNSSWGAGTESAFWAMQQAVTDGDGTPRYPTNQLVATGQQAGWRAGAAKVIVLFGDEPSQQESINEKELGEILQLNDTKVSIIDAGDQDGGNTGTTWDATNGQQLPGAAQEIADGAGGAYIPLINTNQMVEAIMNAVFDAITENTRTGGQLTRIDNAKIWRSRTPSSVEVDTPDDGDTFDFTLRYPGQTDSTFSVDMTTGGVVPNKSYLEKNAVVGGTGTNMFGADLSSNVLIQFTPDKDFIRFLLGNGTGAQIEGYHGYRTSTSRLPSNGITLFDVSSRSVSPYDNLSYSSGQLDTRMSINWATGKVFGIDRASPHPGGTGVGIFLGDVDPSTGKIEGQYIAKTARFTTAESGMVPRYLIDTGRGNTNLQIYGENAPVGMGGTFSINWYDEAQTPSYTSMLMAGFADPVTPSYTSIAQGEVWNGFAVGFVHTRSSGDLTIGRNTDANDVQMTLKPNSGQFSGSITVNDGVDNYAIATADSDSVYVSPQAFGAVKTASAPQHIATTTNGNEQYNYMTWGSWSKDVSTAPQKTVFAHSPWIAGRLTPGNSVPTSGNATYNGNAWGHLNEAAGFTSVSGNANLTADFGARTLSGSFANMKRADNSAWTDINVNATWGAGNNAISGTLNATNGMTGNVNGAFFGPSAQEVGGNWQVQGGGASAAGVFVGKQ